MSHATKGLQTFLGLKYTTLKYSPLYTIRKIMIDDLLCSFKCLRVLSLSNHETRNVISDFIGNLKHLRYLNLERSKIKCLPDFVCALYNLQTLLLSGCNMLVELPSNMGRLVNLHCLDVTYTWLEEMPLEMGKLRNLQNLSISFVGKDSGSNIRELGELRNLSGTFCISNLKNVDCTKDATKVNFKEKKYLSDLELEWGWHHEIDNSENERNVLEQLRPHTNIESLSIQKIMVQDFQAG